MNSKWLPRASNARADNLSRMGDCDDWETKQEYLIILMKHGVSIHVTDLHPSIIVSVKYSIQNTGVLNPVGLTCWSRIGQIVLTGWYHHLPDTKMY